MIVECSGCHARYQYDEARFQGKASKKMRCAKCGTIFEIHNPAGAQPAETPAPAEPQAAAPAPPQPAPQQPAAPKPSAPPKAAAAPPAKAPRREGVGESTHAAKPPAIRVDVPAVELDDYPTARPETPLQMPEGKRLSLAIIDCPDAATIGTVFRIVKPQVTIGRSGADFVINDDEASRQHARIEIRDTLYLVSDLDSKNGTKVDGKKISEPAELQDKSEVVIGATTIMFIVTQEHVTLS